MLNIEPTEPFNDNFNELGFESRYMLNNLGTMVVFYILYPLLMILQAGLFNKCRRVCNCCWRTNKKLKRLLYYELFITVMLESYAIISLCVLIGLPIVTFTSPGLAV